MDHARVRSSIALVAVLGLGACTSPGGPGSVSNPNFWPGITGSAADGGMNDPGAIGQQLRCMPAKAQPLPARSSIFSMDQTPRARTMFTTDLFNILHSYCGACHDNNTANFQTKRSTFKESVTTRVVDIMKLDDPSKFMPPPNAGGKLLLGARGERPAVDPDRAGGKVDRAGKPG
jgi:hypothetical protein